MTLVLIVGLGCAALAAGLALFHNVSRRRPKPRPRQVIDEHMAQATLYPKGRRWP